MKLKQICNNVLCIPSIILKLLQVKRKVVMHLQDHKSYMSPGWYIIETQIASRVGVPLQNGLATTKGYQRVARQGAYARVKSWIMNRLIPPTVVYVKGLTNRQQARCEHLLVSKEGDVKLFSLSGNYVLIHLADSGKRARIVEAHKVLGDYLPVTRLKAYGPNGILLDPLVPGRPLHLAPRERQYEAYRELVSRYTILVQEQAHKTYGSVATEQAIQHALEVTLGLPVNYLINEWQDEIRHFVSRSPLIPSHGDLGGQNILVTDNELTIIDLEDFRPQPFFYDILRLPIFNTQNLGSHDLFIGVSSGMFDEELDRLFSAANMQPFSQRRLVPLLSRLVLQFWHHALFHGELPQRAVQRVSSSFHRFIRVQYLTRP